jgi:hypothetical protein
MTTTISHLVNRFDIESDDTFDEMRRSYESLVPTIDFAELTDVIESGDLVRVRSTPPHTRRIRSSISGRSTRLR